MRTPTRQELKRCKNIRWGYELSQAEDKITYVKLFQDVGQKLPSFLSHRNMAAQLQMNGRNVEAAIADFLKKILEHTMETLTLRWGEAFMHSTVPEYVLTVPAMWSDKAKNSTMQAAKQAGMRGKISMISEVSFKHRF
jgi:molecular chaperone DnaK (HSP70)